MKLNTGRNDIMPRHMKCVLVWKLRHGHYWIARCDCDAKCLHRYLTLHIEYWTANTSIFPRASPSHLSVSDTICAPGQMLAWTRKLKYVPCINENIAFFSTFFLVFNDARRGMAGFGDPVRRFTLRWSRHSPWKGYKGKSIVASTRSISCRLLVSHLTSAGWSDILHILKVIPTVHHLYYSAASIYLCLGRSLSLSTHSTTCLSPPLTFLLQKIASRGTRVYF